MQQITLYMLRRDLDVARQGLRNSAQGFRLIHNRGIAGLVDVELMVRRSDPEPSPWQRDLLSIANHDDLSSLLNRRTGALLSFSYRGYRFVLAYGDGWAAMDPTALEPGFGLKVVANAVAADKIRSADTTALHGRRRSQRTSMSTVGPLYELGIETTEALVRQLEGKPASDFASNAVGGDSLRLRLKDFSLIHLRDKIDQIIDKFEATDYKADFSFLDQYVQIPRSATGVYNVLNETLAAKLQHDPASVDFVSPDLLEPLGVDHFVLETRQGAFERCDELDASEIRRLLSLWNLTDPLKDVTVRAFGQSGTEVVQPHSLFHYIADEIEIDEHRYALCAGKWYLVDADYLAGLTRRMNAIKDVTNELSLPPWPRGEKEGAYNKRVAEARGWECLDRQNFPLGRSRQMEICDLLTPDKRLICVKRMDKSKSLSHLFAQGSVSAELLVSDAAYMDCVLRALKTMTPEAAFGDRRDWTIVYAMETSKPGRLAESLFFFSKVNLDRAVRTIGITLGIDVALARIMP